MSRNTNEGFPQKYEPYLNLASAYDGDGVLNLMRFGSDSDSGVSPLFIEVDGGHLQVRLQDDTVQTTRDYSGFDKFYGVDVKEILQAGTTATAIQVYW